MLLSDVYNIYIYFFVVKNVIDVITFKPFGIITLNNIPNTPIMGT